MPSEAPKASRRDQSSKGVPGKPPGEKTDRSDPNPNFSGSEYQGQRDVDQSGGD